MNSSIFVASCLLILFSLLRVGESYFVLVDADAEECFFDKAEHGVKMSTEPVSIAPNGALLMTMSSSFPSVQV